MTEHDPKHPWTSLPSVCINHECGCTKINLSFVARIDFHAAKRQRLFESEVINETTDAVIASEGPVFRFEILMSPNGHQPLIKLGGNHITVLLTKTLRSSAPRETRKDDWLVGMFTTDERFWPILSILDSFLTDRPGTQVWPVLNLL